MAKKTPRKIPPLYHPFQSWKQAGMAWGLGFAGLYLFHLIRQLIN